MLSYKQFLEKFLTATNNNGYHEFYINPTDKEIKELGDDWRFIIDQKYKKLYITDAELLHDEMFEHLKNEGHFTDFNYKNYYLKGEGADRILTMNKDEGGYYSDSVTDMLFKIRGNDNEEEIKSQVKELINSDFSWIKGKWFNHSQFQLGLNEIREML